MNRRTRGLLAFSAGLAALEAALLQAAGFTSAIPLAPQVSAPAPIAVFHDLRWVWTFAHSPWSTAWMLIALLAFRSVVNATMTWLAWPAGSDRPAYRTALRRSALFTALAAVALSPWATVAFMAGVAGLSTLLLAGIIGSGLITLLLPPGIVTGQWWRKLLPLRSMGWMLLGWLTLSVAALAITFSPDWVTVLVAAGGGLVNGWLWRRIVGTVVEAGRPRWTVPALPVVAVGVSAALLFGAGAVFTGTIGGGSTSSSSSPPPQPGGPTSPYPVLYVGGFDTSYGGGQIHVLPPQFHTTNYSYRGLGPDGQPLPYRPEDTHQSVTVSAERLATQVQALHQRTGRPVSLVAESEGTMVARTYFASTPHPPVNLYLQLSPLLRAGRVYYPLAGHDGYGYLAAWETRGILGILHLESGQEHLTADMPFLRSLVLDAPLYRDQTMCPVPGVRNFMLLPLEGALTVYRGPLSRIPWTAFPGYHASLINGAEAQRIVAEVLAGTQHRRKTWEAAYQLIRGAAGAWQVPALPLHARPGWHAAPKSDPAFGNWACTEPG